MIHGVGTDIIDIKRIRRVINLYGNRLKKKCFHDFEISRSENKFKIINMANHIYVFTIMLKIFYTIRYLKKQKLNFH